MPQQNTFLPLLSVTANLAGILKRAPGLPSSPDVTLKLTGKVKVGKGGIFINAPVNYARKRKIVLR